MSALVAPVIASLEALQLALMAAARAPTEEKRAAVGLAQARADEALTVFEAATSNAYARCDAKVQRRTMGLGRLLDADRVGKWIAEWRRLGS